MPREEKATEAVVEQRVSELVPLVTFMTRRDILQYVTKKGWNLKSRQVDEYIAKARVVVKEEFNKMKESCAESIYNNFTTIYKKALQKDDYELCRRTMNDIAKIMGLNNLDITSKGEKIQGFTVSIDQREDNE